MATGAGRVRIGCAVLGAVWAFAALAMAQTPPGDASRCGLLCSAESQARLLDALGAPPIAEA